MTTDIPRLESPIDAVYAIHKALRAGAARVETLVGQLKEGSSLQPFQQAFYHWVLAWAYHADTEDTSMTSLSPDVPAIESASSRTADWRNCWKTSSAA